MPYIVCRDPGIRMDIMVELPYWADVVVMAERAGCTYRKEDQVEPFQGKTYVILRDIRAPKGHQLGEFLGLLYGMEWKALTEDSNTSRKFYILIRSGKKKGKKVKKNGQEARAEADAGRESGNSGESADPVRSGESSSDPGDRDCHDRPGDHDILRQA